MATGVCGPAGEPSAADDRNEFAADMETVQRLTGKEDPAKIRGLLDRMSANVDRQAARRAGKGK